MELPKCYRCGRAASDTAGQHGYWCSWCGQAFDPKDADRYLDDIKRKEKEDLSAKLLDAVQFDGIAEVQRLIDAGADVNVRNESGGTALRFAAGGGKTRVAELLVRHGARPLTVHMAASLGRAKDVRRLLDEGGDVNRPDETGMTPLHEAFWHGQTEVIKLLIEGGADYREMNDGKPCLHFAAEHRYAEVVEYLLQKGLDVNARDSAQRTPLHMAVVGPIGFGDERSREASLRGRMPTIELLLRSGSDINAKDKYGETALDKAVELKQEEIISLLLQNGATSGWPEVDEHLPRDTKGSTTKKWWQFWK